MRHAIATAAVLFLAIGASGPAAASDLVTTRASGTVAEAMDRIEAAVETAGATVFARVDHGRGAMDIGMDLAPAELLIFGNPQLGTPAMQDDIAAGLILPLRLLVYEDANGTVQVAYEDVASMFDGYAIAGDADYVAKMAGALRKFAAAAAE